VKSSGSIAHPEKPMKATGESRLVINFTNMGDVGVFPQYFGNSKCGIADGLTGTHIMYQQPWEFQIHHHNYFSTVVLITWKVINLLSQMTIEISETTQDVAVREGCGRTKCNAVVKWALDNTRKLVTLDSKPLLTPKQCTVGLLFFGLLHNTVQAHFQACLASRSTKSD